MGRALYFGSEGSGRTSFLCALADGLDAAGRCLGPWSHGSGKLFRSADSDVIDSAKQRLPFDRVDRVMDEPGCGMGGAGRMEWKRHKPNAAIFLLCRLYFDAGLVGAGDSPGIDDAGQAGCRDNPDAKG